METFTRKKSPYREALSKMNLSLASLLIISALLWGCNEDDALPLHQSIDEMNQLILHEMERNDIPSLAACIVKDDQIVWQNTYGYQDIKNQKPPTDETIYLLASISKTFTAVAVMQLYEKGLLDLHDDINRYLSIELRNPHYPDTPITSWMLLTHTSSLAWPTNDEDPQYNDTYPDDTAPPLSTWIPNYLIPGGIKYLPSTWKDTFPGTTYQYSNTGVALLGYIVESITGQDFSDYCQENIFQPLEMRSSGFRLRDFDTSQLASIYHDGSLIEQYSVSHYPASTVRSSLEELTHFLIAIINGGVYKQRRILKEDTVEEMLNIKFPSADIAFLWQAHDQAWIGHIGGYWGVTSSLDLKPKSRTGVILLSNTYGKESLYPDGNIYRIVHYEASKY